MFWFLLLFDVYIPFITIVNGLLLADSAIPKKLRPCPATKWTTHDYDKLELPSSRSFLQSISRPNNTISIEDEYEWLQSNTKTVMESLNRHGALVFQGFQLSQTKMGFRQFCDALSPHVEACEDSLASIGVRSLLSQADGVYRAVDSESLADTYIGLHNDCTYCLAPPYAAFACFQPATKGGGAFLLADGRQVLSALDPNVIQKLCQRGLRVRVAALPTPFLVRGNNSNDVAQSLQTIAAQLLKRIASGGVTAMFPKLQLEVAFSEDQGLLQILEPIKSPLNQHPRTGEWTFFSGIHSQSAYLQDKRAANGFSGMTDVFYAETEQLPMESIEAEVLDHIEKIMNQHTNEVLMQQGDVVLLDSYQVLHGRNTFQGSREHGVIWMTGDVFS